MTARNKNNCTLRLSTINTLACFTSNIQLLQPLQSLHAVHSIASIQSLQYQQKIDEEEKLNSNEPTLKIDEDSNLNSNNVTNRHNSKHRNHHLHNSNTAYSNNHHTTTTNNAYTYASTSNTATDSNNNNITNSRNNNNNSNSKDSHTAEEKTHKKSTSTTTASNTPLQNGSVYIVNSSPHNNNFFQCLHCNAHFDEESKFKQHTENSFCRLLSSNCSENEIEIYSKLAVEYSNNIENIDIDINEGCEILKNLKTAYQQTCEYILNKASQCINCGQSQRTIIFIPCSHFLMCTQCAKSCKTCPICNKHVYIREPSI